jgi:hypothetical protein
MCLESRTGRGNGVVVLCGAAFAEPRDWLAVADAASLAATVGSPRALMLDFRTHGFTPSSRDAGVLATSLAAYPLVAILADLGVSYGCARMVSTLVELRGSPSSAFYDEAEAWRWLSAQLGTDVRDGPPSPHVRTGRRRPGWALTTSEHHGPRHSS